MNLNTLEGRCLDTQAVDILNVCSLLYGILLNVAMSTIKRQCSREASFFHSVVSVQIQWF